MLAKRNPAADVDLETRRLQLAIDGNVVTDYTSANGMGGIDADRMAKAMSQLAENYSFKDQPSVDKVFDASYLPTDGSLKLK